MAKPTQEEIVVALAKAKSNCPDIIGSLHMAYHAYSQLPDHRVINELNDAEVAAQRVLDAIKALRVTVQL